MKRVTGNKIYGYIRAVLSLFMLCGVLFSGTACSTEEDPVTQQTDEAKVPVLEVPDETVEPAKTETNDKKPDKIDDLLWESMEKADDDDLLPVSMWISDIDFEEVEKKVEAETGLSRDIIEQKSDALTAAAGGSGELYREQAKQLNIDVQTYTAAQRDIAKEMHIESNNIFVDAYLSDAKDVCVYEVFPIIDCSITKERIIYLASLDGVEAIYSNADKDIVYPGWMIDS